MWFALCINASMFLLLVKLPDEVHDTPSKRVEENKSALQTLVGTSAAH